MKRLNLLLFFCCLLLSSCSTSSYLSTINTTTEYINKNDVGEFILENDSLQIVYNFSGINAPIHIEIHNKLSKPLYIDWSKSAIIINGIATNYLGKTTKITGITTGSSYVLPSGYSWGTANFVGQVNVTVPVSIIPPKSKVKETHLSLKVNFQNLNTKKFSDTRIGLSEGLNYVEAEQASFSETDTPFSFLSYLTLQYEGEEYFHYNDSFFVEKLIVMKDKIGYKNLPNSIKDRADIFYIEK